MGLGQREDRREAGRMILVHNISLAPQEDAGILRKKAAEKLHIPAEQIMECVLKKRSLDARKKDRIRYVCTVGVTVVGSEEKLLRRCRNRNTVCGPCIFRITDRSTVGSGGPIQCSIGV